MVLRGSMANMCTNTMFIHVHKVHCKCCVCQTASGQVINQGLKLI